MESLNKIAVENFRKYLQIPSVHPNINYNDCVLFLQEMAADLNLPFRVIYVTPKNPVVILTWRGKNPELPTILLNSHMDVVPVSDENWTHEPFAADIEDGKIYARGAQDMKCVGIQYLEAIRRLRLEGKSCLRTIHVCFVPNEETGIEGMELFVQTEEFKEMNVGLCLDEGCANATDEYIFCTGDKTCWQFTMHCKGQSGHGSLLLDNTSAEKLSYILRKAHEFRDIQKASLQNRKLADVVSLNCTIINGGVQNNVIPIEMTATFDCRIPSTYSLTDLEEMINQWCKEAGADCFVEYHEKQEHAYDTKLDDTNIFWAPFKEMAEEFNLQLDIGRCIASTDSRYLRLLGIPCFNFSPMNNTKVLLHGNDEYLGVETFLKGISIYYSIILKVANVK